MLKDFINMNPDEVNKIWGRLIENLPFISEMLSSDEKINKFISEDPVRAGRLIKAMGDLTKAANDFNNVFDEEMDINVEDN